MFRYFRFQDKKYALVAIEGEWWVNGHELGVALGFKRPRDLRSNRFLNRLHKDGVSDGYLFVDGEFTTSYFTYYTKWIGNHPQDGVNGIKGVPLLFFSVRAVKSICERSKVPGASAFWEALQAQRIESPEKSATVPYPGISEVSTSTSGAVEAAPEVEVGSEMLTHTGVDDQTAYKTLQTLLTQLQTLTDDSLKNLAVDAAELLTKRDLSSYRPVSRETVDQKPMVQAEAPRQAKIQGPVESVSVKQDEGILKEGFWSLTTIGRAAGGYSSHQAGSAANVVGKSLGLTPSRIRNQTSFNQIEMVTVNGKPRKVVRFNTDFSNRVIRELQQNYPLVRKDPPELPSFSGD